MLLQLVCFICGLQKVMVFNILNCLKFDNFEKKKISIPKRKK
jgi:hypothetical protein